MIADFIAFLESDATLAALLRAGGSNTKIFGQLAPYGEETPFILYAVSTDGTADALIDEVTISLRHCGETYHEALALVDRVTEIADKQDDVVIPSSSNKAFYCKKIGGSDTFEPDTMRHVLTRLYHLKHKRLNGG